MAANDRSSRVIMAPFPYLCLVHDKNHEKSSVKIGNCRLCRKHGILRRKESGLWQNAEREQDRVPPVL